MLESDTLVRHFGELGALGLACLALIERLVPVIPSHALLILVGMTVLDASLGLPAASVAYTVGSVAGALVWYAGGRALGEARTAHAVRRYGKYLFVSEATYRKASDAYLRRRTAVTFAAQLLPTVRLYMPVPAGVLAHPLPGFVAALTVGSLVWNAFFLAIGLLLQGGDYSPRSAAFVALCVLVAIEAIVGVIAYIRRGFVVSAVDQAACDKPVRGSSS